MINEIMSKACMLHKSLKICAACRLRRNVGSLWAGRQLLWHYDQVLHLYAADHCQSRFDSNFFSNQRAMEIINA